jgi:hypothetical protein
MRKELYNSICELCGQPFTLTMQACRNRIELQLPDYCKRCMAKKRGLEDWNKKSIKDKENTKLLLEKYHWNNLDSEEQKRINSIRQDRFKNMTDEERKKHSQYSSNGSREYWDNISINDFYEKCRLNAIKFNSTIISIPNLDIEVEFDNTLKKYNINYRYQWYNINKHKDFNILFPYNAILNNNLISPHHRWDFIIYTNQGNILIDLDGSIHNPLDTDSEVKKYNGLVYNLRDAVQFNDKQRPYQTDGLEAYIIQCYDDTINNDNIVLKLNYNTMEFEKFSNLKKIIHEILLMNISKKDINKLMEV